MFWKISGLVVLRWFRWFVRLCFGHLVIVFGTLGLDFGCLCFSGLALWVGVFWHFGLDSLMLWVCLF